MFADPDAEERGGLLCSISLMTFQPHSAPWAAAKTGSVGPACWPSLGWSSYCGKSEPEEKFCCTVSSLLWMQPTAAKGNHPLLQCFWSAGFCTGGRNARKFLLDLSIPSWQLPYASGDLGSFTQVCSVTVEAILIQSRAESFLSFFLFSL